MERKYTYKEIAYLIACYIAVADKEINEFEINIIENYLPLDVESVIFQRRQEIFSDDQNKLTLNELVHYLKTNNYSSDQKYEILSFLAKTAFGDDYVSTMCM